MRIAGRYTVTTTLGEPVRAFVPRPLPPADPPLPSSNFVDLNRQAELALARLAGVSGLVPSVEWLLYSAIRKEALLTSQIEGTQATLTDLFDEEAGLKVSNADDVEEITNYLRAFRWVQAQLRDPQGLPISVRMEGSHFTEPVTCRISASRLRSASSSACASAARTTTCCGSSCLTLRPMSVSSWTSPRSRASPRSGARSRCGR